MDDTDIPSCLGPGCTTSHLLSEDRKADQQESDEDKKEVRALQSAAEG